MKKKKTEDIEVYKQVILDMARCNGFLTYSDKYDHKDILKWANEKTYGTSNYEEYYNKINNIKK